MYKKGIYTVTANEPLTPSVWRMTLEGDTQYLTRPGQFVDIEVEGLYRAVRFRCATTTSGR